MKKKAGDTYFHVHMVAASAWRYVVLVVEAALATPFLALWGVVLVGCSLFLKGSCGVP